MPDRSEFPGHGAISGHWPDGEERWGDLRGRGAVFGRLLGIEGSLDSALGEFQRAEDWGAGWELAPNIAAELTAARKAIHAAKAKVRAAREQVPPDDA